MAEFGDTEQGCYVEKGMSGYGVAVQLHREIPMEDAWIKAMAEEMMLEIARKCESRGAKYIGHIKSHVRTEAGTVKADTLGHAEGAYSAGRIEHPVGTLYMAINSILYGLKEAEVKEATLEGIHDVAQRHGLQVDKEKEHAYFDEFDYLQDDKAFTETLEEQFDAADDSKDSERK